VNFSIESVTAGRAPSRPLLDLLDELLGRLEPQ
jgi:hypothetical protein